MAKPNDPPGSRGGVTRSIACGAKKKPAPMYHADPARSEISTKRSHRGIGVVAGSAPIRPPSSVDTDNAALMR